MNIEDNDEEPDKLGGKIEDSDEEHNKVEEHMEDSGKEPDVVEEHRGERDEVEQHREQSNQDKNYKDEGDDYRLSQLLITNPASIININILKPTNFKQLPNTPNPKPCPLLLLHHLCVCHPQLTTSKQ